MSEDDRFDADWLALREPADHAARSRDLAERFLALVKARGGGTILDLGCGAGSNIRYLQGLGASGRDFTGVDADPALLARAASTLPEAEFQQLDASDLDKLPWGSIAGLTCAALLDLVSDQWLDRLIQKAALHGVPILAVLSVDGLHGFDPAHSGDEAAATHFARDQLRDKGFGGAALGPLAPNHALAAVQKAGMQAEAADTPWHLNAADHGALIAAFLEGYALGRDDNAAWLKDRQEALAAGQLSLRIGHRDILAWL